MTPPPGSPTPSQGRNIEVNVSIMTNSMVDSDINDPGALYIYNSEFASAQALENPVTLQGFLTAQPTGQTPDTFADFADVDDYFRVTLRANQAIRLQIADSDAADLDLALYDGDRNMVAFSMSSGDEERISVTEDGEFYVHAYAFWGTSAYVLTVEEEATTEGVAAGETADFVPGEAIVRMADTVTQARASAFLTGSVEDNGDRPTLLRFDTGAAPELALAASVTSAPSNAKLATLIRIKRLRQTDDVEYAEPNYIRRLNLLPDDRYFVEQTNLGAMNLPAAWDITTGFPLTGEVIVAVLDTGIFQAHPDLDGKLVTGYDFVSGAANSGDGDGIDPDPEDPGNASTPWHGTHVAGILAARSNNGLGISGISWGARIMPLRVIGTDGATSYDIMQALRYAAGLSNDSGTLPTRAADIINLSLGGTQPLRSEQELYRQLHEQGIIVVASAGNESAELLKFPASYPTVLAVGAVDSANRQTTYSNYGTNIDLVAPGGHAADSPPGILSTYAGDGNEYVYMAGTSMAAPHVTGMLALMKAVRPSLTAMEVRDLLADGQLSQDLGESDFDPVYGFGLADASLAVVAAANLEGGMSAPPAPHPFMVTFPQSVSMATAQNAGVEVFNKGGGSPTLLGISHNATWLSVGVFSGVGHDSMNLSVNRSGLPPGDYATEVILSYSDGGNITLPVSMAVAEWTAAGQLGRVYPVLIPAINTEELLIVGVAEAATDSARFVFEDVRPGSYYLYAGSDIDRDGVICEAGESCGAWPMLASPEMILVKENMLSLPARGFTLRIYGRDPAPAIYSDIPIDR